MKYMECNIKGFEGLYRIYENGNIYSMRHKRLLKQHPNSILYKYLYVCLTGHSSQVLRIAVHRLVAIHFISPQPPDHIFLGHYEVNHKDMDRSNNHWSNLEWVTHSENMFKARNKKEWKTGRDPGYKHKEISKKKMSEKKMKKVVLINDNECITYDSIQEFCDKNNTYRKKFNRLVNSHRTFNGFKVRYL
jgi:hypothetical protein